MAKINNNIDYVDDQGRLHREGGPASIDSLGAKYWFIHGEKHREDGPAIEWEDGDKWWYLNDKRIKCNTQEEFELLMKLQLFW